ncbi:thiol-disulfide oxidoreductase DCC family protein [Phytopseudomonas dryadis]|uniref:Thiol-disulfide oxidoreductase n=1 Tax=Phytopseudomonas dryadis TaxID=2487520 RepID=A0A4Q9QYJ2_9GAMM|nr:MULTISPECIES: thiol-disulfide oxidoreductase DCC family protein [Pseudomonas]TBU88320.1 thiol-disulfide oxidoreductase [Pseudomonas dryadis]TBV01775.1 thiol-disulfide oxidoreductase [Pseudomonas dryadis]TBV14395.1 thiol-disulfide oxidoreductase [Pseudomonas sp. FRB 230]
MPYPPYLQAGDRVVLYDGVCKLCNGWSRFLLRHDRDARFKLCCVQSPQGQAILAWFDMPLDRFDTLLYVDGEHAHARSDAFLRIIAELPAPWRYLSALRLLPRGLRDWGYERIAQNRYRLFGRYRHCPLPRPEDRARFLHE